CAWLSARMVEGLGAHPPRPLPRLSYRIAWPSGEWGSLPLEGGIEAAYKAQLEAAEDPDALRQEISTRLEKARSPFRTAEAFMIEEIVDPADTRPFLCEFVELAARRPPDRTRDARTR